MCLMNFLGSYPGVIFLILSFIQISDTLVSDIVSDIQSESCKLALNNGDIIDLSALVNSSQPMTVSTNTSLYIYHPCKDISLNVLVHNECQKSYGLCYFKAKNPTNTPIDFQKVILNKTLGYFTLLAHNAEAVLRENRLKQAEIVYKHSKKYQFVQEPKLTCSNIILNGDGTTISTYIRLECNENIEKYKITIDKSLELEHVLTLSSKYICLETEHYMSGGTVFLIILIFFILLYFVGGILVLKFIRGATGVEMIPSHEFWCSLPQLAKDGFKYLTSCGQSTPDSYEKI